MLHLNTPWQNTHATMQPFILAGKKKNVPMLQCWQVLPDASFLRLPCRCYHPNASIPMLASQHWHPVATILLLPSQCYWPDAAILMLLPDNTISMLAFECYNQSTTIPMIPTQCHIAASKEMGHKSIIYALIFSDKLKKRNGYMVRRNSKF